MVQPTDPQPERTETDQSLRAERAKTDRELSRCQQGIEHKTDAAVQQARTRADANLGAIQARASHALEEQGASPSARSDTHAAQAQERSTIAGERQTADRELETERSLRQLALASLLGSERIQTDVHLARERAFEDDALLRVLDELTRAVRFRDEFLTLASHELNTPLTPLVLGLDVLDRDAAQEVTTAFSQKVSRQVATAKKHVTRISTLVSELLDVSRMTSTSLALNLGTVDLGAIVDEVVERYRHRAQRASSALEVSAPTTEGRWDAMRLEQIVENVFENALTFGAGHPIRVALAIVGDHAVLTIQDHGIGIAPEFLPRVFGRFERGVSSRNFGGLGLGLYVCKNSVDALGGTISVQSTLGRGATFTVKLPLAGPRDQPN